MPSRRKKSKKSTRKSTRRKSTRRIIKKGGKNDIITGLACFDTEIQKNKYGKSDKSKCFKNINEEYVEARKEHGYQNSGILGYLMETKGNPEILKRYKKRIEMTYYNR